MMRQSWENFYKTRGRFYLEPHPNFSKVVNRLKTYRSKRVLDLGCGSGRHVIELASAGFEVCGIDFSQEALALAKKWLKTSKLTAKLKRGNIHKKLPYRSNFFDAVIAIDSIHYENSKAMNTTLDEIQRVLKPDKILFITLPTQIGNPLITHLIFEEEEIKEILAERFTIFDSFFDERKYLCVFALNKAQDKVVNLKF